MVTTQGLDRLMRAKFLQLCPAQNNWSRSVRCHHSPSKHTLSTFYLIGIRNTSVNKTNMIATWWNFQDGRSRQANEQTKCIPESITSFCFCRGAVLFLSKLYNFIPSVGISVLATRGELPKDIMHPSLELRARKDNEIKHIASNFYLEAKLMLPHPTFSTPCIFFPYFCEQQIHVKQERKMEKCFWEKQGEWQRERETSCPELSQNIHSIDFFLILKVNFNYFSIYASFFL